MPFSAPFSLLFHLWFMRSVTTSFCFSFFSLSSTISSFILVNCLIIFLFFYWIHSLHEFFSTLTSFEQSKRISICFSFGFYFFPSAFLFVCFVFFLPDIVCFCCSRFTQFLYFFSFGSHLTRSSFVYSSSEMVSMDSTKLPTFLGPFCLLSFTVELESRE